MLDRRRFIGATTAAAASFCVSPARAAAAPQSAAPLDIRSFGVAGDGVRNDTAAFQAAFRVSRALFIPAGIYLLDQLLLPAGTALLTEGLTTVFRQRSGLAPDTRLISVLGSDVRIGDCSVEGNIGSDTGEQRHGIFVAATDKTGDIRGVRIGNVRGVNLRGDVVYLGASKGWSLSDISVGDVRGSNVLRNVVSVVGGSQIRIGNITGDRVGLTHLDIEPDEWNEPVQGCDIASVHGGFVQIAGQTARCFVDGIRIGELDLASPDERAIPPYVPGLSREHAIEIRNVKSLEIGRMVIDGFKGAAIHQIWDPGALPDQYVRIHDAQISDCAKGGAPAYVLGDRRATHIEIDNLVVDIARPGADVILNCKSAHIGSASGRLPRESRLIAKTADYREPLAYAVLGATAAATVFHLGRHLRR